MRQEKKIHHVRKKERNKERRLKKTKKDRASGSFSIFLWVLFNFQRTAAAVWTQQEGHAMRHPVDHTEVVPTQSQSNYPHPLSYTHANLHHLLLFTFLIPPSHHSLTFSIHPPTTSTCSCSIISSSLSRFLIKEQNKRYEMRLDWIYKKHKFKFTFNIFVIT
jgi:hypothetical protein